MILGNNSTVSLLSCDVLLLHVNDLVKTIAALNLIWGFDISIAKDPKTGKEFAADPNTFTEVWR